MKTLIVSLLLFSVSAQALTTIHSLDFTKPRETQVSLGASFERNLEILRQRPADLSKVQGFNLPTDEFDPFAPGADQALEDFDRAYEERYNQSAHLDQGLGLNGDLLETVGGCYQISCPVYAYVSRANQTLSLYLNGQLVDTWLVSTGMPGHGTPALNTHVTSRIYTAYTSTKFPGGDYNGLGNMPYAVFVSGGIAIHGTPQGNWRRLGTRASHGCIRVHPSNAAVFNRLVRENGPRNVWVVVD